MSLLQSKKIRISLLLVVVLLMLAGSAFTPYSVDDWSYMFSFATGERIASVGDIFPSMAAHAQRLNGRLIAHFWAQLFLLLPKMCFNVVNSLVFAALIYGMYRLALPKGEMNNLLLFLIFCAVWIFTPVFGQVFFWLDGACNYGWGALAGVVFLLPYAFLYRENTRRTPLFWILWMLPGFYTGAYLENTAIGAIFTAALLVAACRWGNKEKTGFLPVLPILTAAGGFVSLFASPAEGGKMSASLGVSGVFSNFWLAMRMYGKLEILLLAFAVGLALAVYYRAGRKSVIFSGILFLGSCCANFSLSLASYYPDRCLLFPAILLIAADAVLVSELFQGKTRVAVLCLASALAFSAAYWVTVGLGDVGRSYARHRQNETAITEALGRGENSVTVPVVNPQTKYTAFYGLTYLDENDPQCWVNTNMARAFGIGEICGSPAEE